ncbi:nucleoside deaminase [Promicromonospora sukumoe]|uniref:Guanine deaminase n=1 Tax=Promicromonospora sukumoe TaxID=88382 RepID=A0A7W3PFC5_9MICO|nr:nucleoside deaminase [Promicromonospora sukumoe]MBA8809487.1 guanine deaminase [Promicromonospora sukumoe]
MTSSHQSSDTTSRTAASPEDAAWLARAVEVASRNVADGGGPFGAVVVRAGAEIASAGNRVTRDLDPTAHAEVVAIRAACQELGTFSLAGTTLYASCEPCPLCLSAALWARVDRVVFAADRHDAERAGFDDREFYELLDRDRSTWPNPVVEHRIERAGEPFEAWRVHTARVPY